MTNEKELTEERQFNTRLLMFTTLIISGCSIIYEVLISSVSSYLVGDSIKQFSITIGLYMSAMGLGSFLSKYIKRHLFDWFVFVEIGVGIAGGLSAVLLFFSYVYLETYTLVMYIEIIIIGLLVGLEIPLLTRIIEENIPNLRVTLSTLFSFDYIGGLIGSIAFPLFLLPQLGYFTTAFVTGSLNIVVALIIIFKYRSFNKHFNLFKWFGLMTLAVMIFGALFSENIAGGLEDNLYRDRVILSKQTPYQKIIMTKHKDDLRLYLDGNLQFSTMDEYRYHESLVHIPMAATQNKEKILILGGGDGLAARELLKYDEVKNITLVDLDEQMVNLCQTNPEISKLNGGSLSNNKLKVVIQDAYKYLEKSNELFDVIIVDLPDPNNDTLNKLYTNIFYRMAVTHLNTSGVMCVQSTSPYYAKKAFWCVNKTLEQEQLNVIPYHTEVPTFGDWGFQLVSKQKVDISKLKVSVATRYLNTETISRLFIFSEDEKVDKSTIAANTLTKPQLITYYLEAVKDWR